jgi:hypothetical protein
MLQKFQSLYPNDQDFEPTIRSLMAELSEHIEEEERDDLPALEDNLPEGQSEALAKSFQRTKLFVPTRSHPSAPDKPVSTPSPLTGYLLAYGLTDSIAFRNCRWPHGCSD